MSDQNLGEADQNLGEDNEEECFELNEEDIVTVIELDDLPPENGSEASEGDDDADDEDEMDVDGALAIIPDDSKLVFTGHNDSVFCVRIDPTSRYAVTGGQDDKAVVWDIKTGNVLFECTGHKDSVTSVGWSHDGQFIATADLSGVIKVWNGSSKDAIWSFESGDVEWLQWHSLAHVLLVGTADGEVWMWKIPDGDTKTFSGHGSGALSGLVMPDGKRACVGYGDGTVKLWDLKTGDCLHSIKRHSSSVVSLHAHQNNNLVISGSTDASAKLINTNTGKVLSTYDCSSHRSGSAEDDNSVESVALSNVVDYAATGTLGGVVAVWDVSTHGIRHLCVHEDGIVKVKWDASLPLLYTACLDGVIRLWDSRSGKEESRWTGHTAGILDFDIALDKSSFVSVCEDHTGRVFSLQDSKT